MSKKNNKATKARYHELSLAREREAVQKKQQKAEKKLQKEAAQKSLGVKKTLKRGKRGGIRIRKGLTVKGIKIVDAESKKLAKSKLLAEDKEHEMEVDKPVQRKKTVKKSKKSKAKDV